MKKQNITFIPAGLFEGLTGLYNMTGVEQCRLDAVLSQAITIGVCF